MKKNLERFLINAFAMLFFLVSFCNSVYASEKESLKLSCYKIPEQFYEARERWKIPPPSERETMLENDFIIKHRFYQVAMSPGGKSPQWLLDKYRKMYERFPEDRAYIYLYARLFGYERQQNKDLIDKLLSKWPDFSYGYLLRANYYAGQKLEKKFFVDIQKSCDLGNAIGCSSLGSLYVDWSGVNKSYEKAYKYFDLACDQGESSGCTGLGSLYENGYGLEQSYDLAFEYYKVACINGDEAGCSQLGFLFNEGQGVEKSFSVAARLYEIGCNNSLGWACGNLGILYQNGEGVQRSPETAVRFAEQGCSLGDMGSCGFFAACYRHGIGVKKSIEKATELYIQACHGNDEDSCKELRRMYSDLMFKSNGFLGYILFFALVLPFGLAVIFFRNRISNSVFLPLVIATLIACSAMAASCYFIEDEWRAYQEKRDYQIVHDITYWMQSGFHNGFTEKEKVMTSILYESAAGGFMIIFVGGFISFLIWFFNDRVPRNWTRKLS